MLNPPPKLCKSCTKSPRHTGRTECLLCIQKKQKELAKVKRIENEKKVKARKDKVKQKKSFSASKLTTIADKMFSLYIRKRDEWKPCITCEHPKEDMQCWHFVSRGEYSVRWERKNANAQCSFCNSKHGGNGEVWKHWKAIDRIYWPWTADYLESQRWLCKVYDHQKLEYIRRDYWGLVELGMDVWDIFAYFQKAMGAKSFDITKYL